MLLYYITDRSHFSGDETSRRKKLLEKVGEAAKSGVDFIQLRERDLSTRDLAALAQEAVRVIRENPASPTRLLINSRTDVAIAGGAAGVHLRSVDISPKDVRVIWSRNSGMATAPTIISVACHTVEEVALAARSGADFAIFGPIFEKQIKNTEIQIPAIEVVPTGLNLLRQACRENIPVIALGGITSDNAGDCLEAGAAGIAAIRLFQENPLGQIVRRLRGD